MKVEFQDKDIETRRVTLFKDGGGPNDRIVIEPWAWVKIHDYLERRKAICKHCRRRIFKHEGTWLHDEPGGIIPADYIRGKMVPDTRCNLPVLRAEPEDE